MPTFKAELLMRDKRLEWLQEQGVTVNYVQLEPDELADALRSKLLEEATEAAIEVNPQEMIKELADILEVVQALAKECNISPEELAKTVTERKENLGGFEQRLYSQSVSMPDGHPAEAYYRENILKYPEIK